MVRQRGGPPPREDEFAEEEPEVPALEQSFSSDSTVVLDEENREEFEDYLREVQPLWERLGADDGVAELEWEGAMDEEMERRYERVRMRVEEEEEEEEAQEEAEENVAGRKRKTDDSSSSEDDVDVMPKKKMRR